VDFEFVRLAVEAQGLVTRGGFHPEPADDVPAMSGNRPVGTLVLVGVVGEGVWRAFQSAPESKLDSNPLDSWSRRVIEDLARPLDASALFPFGGPPFLPFIRWAQRAETVYPSLMGPLIHPDYGLWHAYRGALAFEKPMDLPARDERPCPCDTCADRPCLSTCPVNAFGNDGYDVPSCTHHIASDDGVDCLTGGCLARRACPVGKDYHYADEQMGFHMRAFLRAHRG
jgi:hypothetical protein